MATIIMDLEWNTPILDTNLDARPLSEIIQIGAVRLEHEEGKEDTFSCIVRAELFPKLHWQVRKLTGLTTSQVAHGLPFPEAIERFKEWCGEDPVFITWGFDDIPVLNKNLDQWDMDVKWCQNWYNIQLVFCSETQQPVRQRSLAFAVEYYQIPKDVEYHDALNDAYYTREVCKKINLEEGIKNYQHLFESSASQRNKGEKESRLEVSGLESARSALTDERIMDMKCPRCGREITDLSKWLDVGQHRFFTYGRCASHGIMQIWIRVTKQEDETFNALREISRGGITARQYYLKKENNRAKKQQTAEKK